MPDSRLRCAGLSRAALALAVVLLAAGCEGRLRSNPLDPENPSTGGGPIGFVAVAENLRVTLGWRAAPGSAELQGFLLERRQRGPNAFVPVGPLLPVTASGYEDNTVANDIDYEYRLSYVLPSGEISGTSVIALARPGPEIGWVADPGTDEVVRVTPDGRARVLTLSGVTSVNRISVQLSGGQIWATEPIDGRVRRWTFEGLPLDSFNGLAQPNAIVVDPGTLTAWIAEELGPRVRRWTSTGVVQGSTTLLGLPSDIALRAGGGAWVVDQARGLLLRVDLSGNLLDTIDVGSDPRRIAVDALDGSVWVSRFTAGEVVHVAANGTVLGRIPGLEGPYALDVDEFRNQVWVGLDGANAVQVLARSNGARLFRVGGIARPRGLAVADRTGECWVVAIQAHELIRINAAGTIESRNAGFSAPFDVRVDPGPR
jgi:DNA-binding beta-propeller fold protein YncE